MLDRNKRVKPCPERFQDANDEFFNVVFTVEERIFDIVKEELESRGPENYIPVHIININIQDNHDEATFGSFLFYEICQMINKSEDLEDHIESILQAFEEKHTNRTFLHSVVFS